MSPRSVFFAGMFITMLVIKPGFGTAILESMGNVTGAAFATTVPRYEQPVPQPIVREEVIIEEVSEKPDRLNELIAAITTLVERVDRIEQGFNKPTDMPKTEKEAAYQKALQTQTELERKAGYDGNDPYVRSRHGLPPKVPPFDLFMVNGEMDTQQFDRAFASKHGDVVADSGKH